MRRARKSLSEYSAIFASTKRWVDQWLRIHLDPFSFWWDKSTVFSFQFTEHHQWISMRILSLPNKISDMVWGRLNMDSHGIPLDCCLNQNSLLLKFLSGKHKNTLFPALGPQDFCNGKLKQSLSKIHTSLIQKWGETIDNISQSCFCKSLRQILQNNPITASIHFHVEMDVVLQRTLRNLICLVFTLNKWTLYQYWYWMRSKNEDGEAFPKSYLHYSTRFLTS